MRISAEARVCAPRTKNTDGLLQALLLLFFIYLLVCSLFYNAFSLTQTMALNERMISELQIEKDFEGSSHDLI
jgi:hypothetical protein